MFSSSGDIVCTLIVEIIEVFNERSGAYRKLRLKLGGGALIVGWTASSISREGRFLSYPKTKVTKSKE